MNLFGTVELSTAKKAVVLLDGEGVNETENVNKRITCKNKPRASVGDKVEVSVLGNCQNRAKYFAMLLPLLFALVGILLSLFTTNEILRFAVISGAIVVGFLLALVAVYFINCKSNYSIINILTPKKGE